MTVAGPDKGYSWVIMFCCAFIHFALFGLFRSWGVIYVAVLQDYNVTREEASWPFNMCSSVFQLVGPAVSIFTHYISNRSAVLLGCTIATIGVVGCYFAENVMWLTIFYGIIHGLGFGIVVTLIPVLINQYFVKHRATAIGIAFSGGSISSFIVPIAMEWLLENYNLRGSFLLLGGVVMKTLIAAALLRPPPWLKKRKKTTPKLLEDSEAKDSGVSTSGDATNEIKGQVMLAIDCEQQQFQESNDSNKHNENDISSIAGDSQLDTSKTCEEDASENQDTVVSNNDSMLFDSSVSKVFVASDSSTLYKSSRNENSENNDCEVREPLMSEIIKTNANVLVMPTYVTPKNKKSRFKIVSAYHSISEIIKRPMFHLIAFTMFVFFMTLQSFFVVIVDYARDKGIPENDGVYLMSIFSLTDLVGRSGLGWITDRSYVKRKSMVILNLISIGTIMQLYPLINNFSGLLAVAAFHGITTGSCITLFFVLQAEYLGMKRLTLVVGLTSFLNGALTLFRPAMIGLFRDELGSYDLMFHCLGTVSLLFSLIWIGESWWNRDKINLNKSFNEKA